MQTDQMKQRACVWMSVCFGRALPMSIKHIMLIKAKAAAVIQLVQAAEWLMCMCVCIQEAA